MNSVKLTSGLEKGSMDGPQSWGCWLDLPSGSVNSEFNVQRWFKKGLGFAGKKLSVDIWETCNMLEQNDRKAHSFLRYGIAKRLSQNLGSLGNIFSQIYVYGSCVDGRATFSSDIDLITVVRKKTDSLPFYLAQINVILTSKYHSLLKENKPSQLLDVKVIDDSDLAEDRGSAAIINSLHEAPIKLWSTAENTQFTTQTPRG